MSLPISQKDAATSKHFCSWCTAWRANSEIDVVGYIEPSPQIAALESQKHDVWIRKLQGFMQQEERGEVYKNNSLVEHQDAVEQAPETTCFENGGEITTCSDKMKANSDDPVEDNSQKGGKDVDEEAEDAYDLDTKAKDALGLPPRRVLDLIKSADTCFLCNKLWESFNRWAIEKYGSLDCLDMSTSRVEVAGRWPKRLSEEGEEPANYSGYGYDGVHGRLCFLQVSITVREPGNTERWAGPSVMLQKSYQVAPSVVDIFDSDEHFDDCNPLLWPDNEPYVARKRPLVADMRLFQKWKGLCSAAHDHRCRPGRIPFNGKHRLTTLRLIDVENFSLIEIKNVEDVSWVTLSYVWGLEPFRTLTKDSLEEFKEAGALSASWVPTTIADAIQVTKGIGERYLWVDSLCIIQDSLADKASFIPYMDVIYGRACVTIINASGDGAFGGLPGVRPNTRFQTEEPFELDGTWFVQSLKKMGDYKIFGDSKWFTRGWTFQEAILSPRWLVFTPEQVYWECRQATWREDACWELPHFREKNQTVIYDPGFDDAFQDLWTLSSVQKFDKTYQCLVNRFVKHDLTQESDGLNAFSGILRAITQVCGIDFFWGLPKIFLGVALTWPCARDQVRRRTALCAVETAGGGRIVMSHFPSWSWVGWVGRIYFDDVFGYLDSEHAGLEFYYFEFVGEGDVLTIQQIPQNKTFRHKEDDYGKPFRGTNPSWRGDTTTAIQLSDIPVGLLEPELRHTVLAFWTSRAELLLQYDGNARRKGKWDTECFSLWVDGTTKLDVMWDQYPQVVDANYAEGEGMQRSTVECIVVGRDSLERSRERGQLRVLLVARHLSGGLSRQGQVAIWEEDWNRMQNRNWEIAFLI